MRIGALTLVLLVAAAAQADSWAPFEDYRVKSPRGSASLLLRKADRDTVTFVLATEANRVRGTLSWIPSEVEVLEDGEGAVLFETYAHGYGHGKTFVRLNAKGETAWKLGVGDLKLGAEWTRYTRSDASICYCLFWAVDGKRVFLVTTQGSIRFIDLKGGAVSVLPASDALAYVRKWAAGVGADRTRRDFERLAALHMSKIEVLDRNGIRMWQLTRPNPFRAEWEPSFLRQLLRADADAVVRVALRDPSLRGLALSIASFMGDDGVAPVLEALAESNKPWTVFPEMQPEFSRRLCAALSDTLPNLDEASRVRTVAWLTELLKRKPNPRAQALLDARR